MGDTIIQTDDGQLLWYNPQTKLYSIVTTQEMIQVEAEASNTEVSQGEAETSTRTDEPRPTIKCKANYWNKKETVLLLSLCIEYKNELENPKKQKKDIFKKVAEKMKDEGYLFSWEQCQGRMKTLLSKYKEIKDHNNTSGRDHKRWDYFDLMSQYCEGRPSIQPTASCSSLQLLSLSHDEDTDNQTHKLSHPTKKRRIAANPRSTMLKWLQEYEQRGEEQEQKRRDLAEKHHQENLEVIKTLVEVLKSKNTNE